MYIIGVQQHTITFPPPSPFDLYTGIKLTLDLYTGTKLTLDLYTGIQLTLDLYTGIKLTLDPCTDIQLTLDLYTCIQLTLDLYTGIKLTLDPCTDIQLTLDLYTCIQLTLDLYTGIKLTLDLFTGIQQFHQTSDMIKYYVPFSVINIFPVEAHTVIWYVLENKDINDLAHARISNACLCVLCVRDTAAKSFFTTISHNVKFLKGYSFKIGGNN